MVRLFFGSIRFQGFKVINYFRTHIFMLCEKLF